MVTGVKSAVLIFSVLLSSGVAVGDVVYVDPESTGPTHDGTSWCAAHLSLSEALDVAGFGDIVRVAGGEYTPDPTGLVDSRDATFAIPNGVTVEGGYAGCGAPFPNQRDLQLFETILSGDLAGDDQLDFGNRGDNAYHVVTTHDVDDTTVLDGLTITAGHADGPNFGASVDSRDQGGGVNNYYGHPVLVNCTIVDNYTDNHGAFNDHGGATLTGCSFRDNWSDNVAGGLYMHFNMDTAVTDTEFINNTTAGNGGGAYHKGNTTSSFTNCVFSGNVANYGGGMYCVGESHPTLTNCTFAGNVAFKGGGISCLGESHPTLTNCTFTGNTTTSDTSGNVGGGIYILHSSPMLTGCVFSGNSGPYSGMYNGGISSNPTLTNCSFINNGGTLATVNNSGSSPTFIGCTFSGNSSRCMYSTGGNLTMIDCTITDHNSGGIWIKFCDATFRNCLFSGNSNVTKGGALFSDSSSPTLTGCVFIGNSAGGYGGAINSRSPIAELPGAATLVNCVFIANSAPRGGAIADDQFSHSTLVNCVFNANTASQSGGAISLRDGAQATLYNCTLANNAATTGSALSFVGSPGTASYLTNCILHDNGEEIANDNNSQITITYTNIQGGWDGIGNIDVEPWFVDSDGADDVPGSLDDDLRLSPGSPGIDAGSNMEVPTDLGDIDDDGDTDELFPLDLMANPRFMDITENVDVGEGAAPIVDMGAYEAVGSFLRAAGSRYAAITPSAISAEDVAIMITSPDYPCMEKYADSDGFLVDAPVYRAAAQWGVVHVHGSELVPEVAYFFQLDNGVSTTNPVPMSLWLWGDVDNNGVANLADAQLVVLGFQGDFSGASVEAMDLLPCEPNGIANLEDVFGVILAFQGNTYADGACMLPCP